MTSMNSWLETLGESVIGAGWIVFWLLLVFGLILQWFPKTNVHFQYGAACLVLLRLCLPLGFFMSYGILPTPQSGELIEVTQVDSGIRNVVVIENTHASRQGLIESPIGGKTLIGVGGTLKLTVQATAQNSSETQYSFMQWIGFFWITGFVLSLVFWGIRTLRFVGGLRRCRPVEDEEINRMFQIILKRLNLSQEILLIETPSNTVKHLLSSCSLWQFSPKSSSAGRDRQEFNSPGNGENPGARTGSHKTQRPLGQLFSTNRQPCVFLSSFGLDIQPDRESNPGAGL